MDVLNSDLQKLSFPEESLDSMVQRYNVCLSETLQNNAPLIEKYVRIRPNSAWFNSHIRHAKVMKRRLERKYRKSELEADLEKYKEQCNTVKLLLTKYKTEFYSCKINQSRNDIKKLYDLSKTLLGEVKQPKLPECDSHQLLAEKFNKFFVDKILKIRSTIKNSLSQKDVDIKEYIHPNLEVALKSFKPADEDEVRKTISASSNASAIHDPFPSRLIKDNLDTLTPVITRIVNKSLEEGVFPSNLKHANITPLLKKENLDKEILKNYRPVSNLPILSKVIEKIVAARLRTHLEVNKLWCKMQSAYRPFHSTKSALLCVQNDILSSLNNKKMVTLVLLDLSAAFDTIDHEKLLHRLETRFGINGTALDWFRSYLSNRSQAVRINNSSSKKMYLNFGVPQGSVLGPILFTLHVAPVADIANKHGVSHMLYADDTQLYVEFNKSSMAASLQHLELCIDGIKSWMSQNILKLNEDKTEVIVFGSRKYLEGMPSISNRVGDCTITPTRFCSQPRCLF